MSSHDEYLQRALALAAESVEQGGRPFGAVIVRNGEVVAEAVNTIHLNGDPTAHAELNGIRDVSTRHGSTALRECVVYASGQPCPMCLSAMYLTGVQAVYFANGNQDGEDSQTLYCSDLSATAVTVRTPNFANPSFTAVEWS